MDKQKDLFSDLYELRLKPITQSNQDAMKLCYQMLFEKSVIPAKLNDMVQAKNYVNNC